MRSKYKAVIFARSNAGEAAITEQELALKQYADDREITVVRTIRLPFCSADDRRVEQNLSAMLEWKRKHPFGMLIVSDLSRLSRRGVYHAMRLIDRMASAGVCVVPPELGPVAEQLRACFPTTPKGEKVQTTENEKKKSDDRAGRDAANGRGGSQDVPRDASSSSDRTRRTGTTKKGDRT